MTRQEPLPTLLSTVIPRLKKDELGSIKKSERQKLQRLYTQDFAAYGSVRSLAKAAKLSRSNVREILHSKTSYTGFTQATRKFKRRRVFARLKGETYCMDLAYVDKLAKNKNGVNFLPARQDWFHRTADAKGMKTKDSKETVKTFSKMITQKNRPTKNWVHQETENAAEFKKICSAEGIQIISTMSGQKRHLQNVQYAQSSTFCIASWRIVGTNKFIIYPNLLQ